MTRPATAMPLYPSEARIALEVLGAERAREWPAIARHLEGKHGFPAVDAVMGGRHWDSVVAFFRVRHGLVLPGAVDGAADPATMGGPAQGRIRLVPFRPDGKERFDDGEDARAAAGRRGAGRSHR